MFTLTEAYEAFKGHDEFVAKEYSGKVSFDYIVITPSSFAATEDEIRQRAVFLGFDEAPQHLQDSILEQARFDINKFARIRRNFRGVTFDLKTGEMISLPLNKFFNVNQIEETQYHLIKDQTATIYEKMDGTMIHFFLHEGRLHASTCRSAENEYSQAALNLAIKNKIDGLIVDAINKGHTPIFEYVAPNNQIVVFYKKPRLVYLISRDRTTGEYHFDETFPDKADRFTFSFSEVYQNLDKTDFEGYVCHLPGMIVKVKTNWYNERHRAVDALMRPSYHLYQLVFDGAMDDLIAMAAESFRPELSKIYEEAQHDFLKEKLRIEQIFEELKQDFSKNKKEYVPKNAFDDIKSVIDDLVSKGKKIEAIKTIRSALGIGIADAKKFVEENVLPHGLILLDEENNRIKKDAFYDYQFFELVRNKFPQDLPIIMALYQGSEYDYLIKQKLMNCYREKYRHKLYANLEENHEDF